MSFLTRLAATREGAEKLMNADLLVKLGECEFLAAKPIDDASSMGTPAGLSAGSWGTDSFDCVWTDFDGFLPSTSERHHQLLLPALQLVVNTLVSFGADTAIATRQAMAFVSRQRENLLIALKNCATLQTLPSMQEARLIITLLGIILPSMSEEEMVS